LEKNCFCFPAQNLSSWPYIKILAWIRILREGWILPTVRTDRNTTWLYSAGSINISFGSKSKYGFGRLPVVNDGSGRIRPDPDPTWTFLWPSIVVK
jgi:hypothetical protein